DSLAAVRLLHEINEYYGTDITETDFVGDPTPEHLARSLASTEEETARHHRPSRSATPTEGSATGPPTAHDPTNRQPKHLDGAPVNSATAWSSRWPTSGCSRTSSG